jgi:translation initiation factor IF-3
MIRVPLVRLIDPEGEQLGIIPIEQAQAKATEAGMDLVEVAPNSDPPVCRIMDYGKYKYQQAKKSQEAKKKQTQTQVKEIKMRPKIADHDFNTKLNKILGFLEEKNRVKVTVQFRGREIAYTDAGRDLLARVAQETQDVAQIDGTPKLEGRFMTMYLAPRSGS